MLCKGREGGRGRDRERERRVQRCHQQDVIPTASNITCGLKHCRIPLHLPPPPPSPPLSLSLSERSLFFFGIREEILKCLSVCSHREEGVVVGGGFNLSLLRTLLKLKATTMDCVSTGNSPPGAARRSHMGP